MEILHLIQKRRTNWWNQVSFSTVHYRVNKKGKFNVGWGKRDKISIDYINILSVSHALQNTNLIHGDFANVLKWAGFDDFIYIDPPYPDSFSGYTAVGFNKSDHHRLKDVCDELNSRGAMFLQSNRDCPFIRDLYKHYEIVPVEAVWSVSCRGESRGKKSEVLIMNY